MDEFPCSNILDISPAANSDVVVKVDSEALATKVVPGQYLYILDDNLSNSAVVYPVGSEPAQNNISLYISAEIFAGLNLQKGDSLRLSLPQGRAFPIIDSSSRLLIIADASGLPSVLFLSQIIAASKRQKNIFILLCSDFDFPFKSQPAKFLVSHMPAYVIAACPLLEDRNIANRLVSGKSQPGCYDGDISELLNEWLAEYLAHGELTIFANGQRSFLTAIAEASQPLGVSAHLFELPAG